MTSRVPRSIIAIFGCGIVFAQQEPITDRIPQVSRPRGLLHAYQAPSVAPVNLANSQRIFDLIHAGQIYLSLQDAIALALKNNLDIELERFLPATADTDVLRARGGGLLRGLSLLVNEPPPGIGGPTGPLLTNLTAGSTPSALVNTNFSDIALTSQQQNTLSITDPIPMAPRSGHSAIRSHPVRVDQRSACDDIRVHCRSDGHQLAGGEQCER